MISSLATPVTGAPVAHFLQQQMLDALEILDPKHANLIALQTYGELKVHNDGTSEFFWKGKRAILFYNQGIDSSGKLVLEAIHKYEGIERKASF